MRSHRDGAINIPFDELSDRAGKELAGATRLIIDCPQSIAHSCRYAATIAMKVEVPEVFILGVAQESGRETIKGTLARAVELLERRDYLRFMRELVPPESIQVLTRTMSLEAYVTSKSDGDTFARTLSLIKAAQLQDPKVFGETAIFTFAPPVSGTERFLMRRLGADWYLGI